MILHMRRFGEESDTKKKWQGQDTYEDHSKRSRGNSSVDVSDAHVNIDLNTGEDVFPDEFEDVEADPVPPPPTRPIGMDKAKRAARFGEELEKKEKHREEMQRAMMEHLETTKEKKQLRQQHLEYLRQQEERALARQTQIEERERVRQAREDARQAHEDARVAQEEHIRQQQEIINAISILEMKTRADLRGLR